jgi:hypothetical protein
MPNRDDILAAATAAMGAVTIANGATVDVSRVVGWAFGPDDPDIGAPPGWTVAVYTDGPERAGPGRDSTQIEWSLPLTVLAARRYAPGEWSTAELADGTATAEIRTAAARMLDEIKVALGPTLNGYAIDVMPTERVSDDGLSPLARTERNRGAVVMVSATFAVRHHETRGRTP